MSQYCRICKEIDHALVNQLCPDCVQREMERAFVERCADIPLTTPHEAMKWVQWVKYQAIEIRKGRDNANSDIES